MYNSYKKIIIISNSYAFMLPICLAATLHVFVWDFFPIRSLSRDDMKKKKIAFSYIENRDTVPLPEKVYERVRDGWKKSFSFNTTCELLQ